MRFDVVSGAQPRAQQIRFFPPDGLIWEGAVTLGIAAQPRWAASAIGLSGGQIG
jgi:hypothetical protein